MQSGIQEIDPEIAAALEREVRRQDTETLVLIASENFVSRAVLDATSSVLTNKYAEGYPGRRYYGGCENADTVERLAIERAKAMFAAEHANVQPHSGSQANMAVYVALLRPGDTLLGMDLSHGGHLTHEPSPELLGRYFRVAAYGVDRTTERIDYDEVARIARAAPSAAHRQGARAPMRASSTMRACGTIADEVGALLMADVAHVAGLIAAGAAQNPDAHTSTS